MADLRETPQASRSKTSQWRIVVIYLGLGPSIGAALMAAISVPIAIATSPTPSESLGQIGFGVAFLLGMFFVGGFIFGAAPALLAGIAASFLHRIEEPKWRSALVGLAAGGVASAIAIWAYSGLRGVVGFPWPMVCVGTFAGAACGLLQRRQGARRSH